MQDLRKTTNIALKNELISPFIHIEFPYEFLPLMN